MTIKAIMSEFCERNGIAYDPENGGGTVSLRVGDDTVLIVPGVANDELNVLAAIGEPTTGGPEAFERLMLEANMQLAVHGDATLSFDNESGVYVVVETVSADGLDADVLRDAVANVVALKDDWKERLGNSCSTAAEGSSAGNVVIKA